MATCAGVASSGAEAWLEDGAGPGSRRYITGLARAGRSSTVITQWIRLWITLWVKRGVSCRVLPVPLGGMA